MAACRAPTAAPDEFEAWLSDKLRALKTDEAVFGAYIAGILDGEESLDDKTDALEGILSEFVECDISTHVSEILDKWSTCRAAAVSAGSRNDTHVDLQLARLMEAAAPSATAPRCYTDEEKKIRDVILSQYSQLSDHEESADTDVGGGGGGGGGEELERNTNAACVAAAARERREQARLDSQRKKDKDKEDREKQKQLKEEKKEKRKTQKGERKR